MPLQPLWRSCVAFLTLSLVQLINEAYSFSHASTFLNHRYALPKRSEASGLDNLVDSPDPLELCRSKLANRFPFPLDDWQLQAGGELLLGHNVMVCAPTGSGKSVCGMMALQAAMDRGLEGIYTTPLKALSNQKFTELRETFSPNNVGLVTGDLSINQNAAQINVMTTEVYRNIAWRSNDSALLGENDRQSSKSPTRKRNRLWRNGVVVLDEFQYMGTPGRGSVWEECIITTPPQTQILGLSATLSNADELTRWIEDATGRKTVLIKAPSERPVPLKFAFAARKEIYPLFQDPDAVVDNTSIQSDSGQQPESPKDLEEECTDSLAAETKTKLPKGLTINPTLKRLARKRNQRVEEKFGQQRRAQRPHRQWNGKFRYRRQTREQILRREMEPESPSLEAVISRLQEEDLLPAIFFIFSRAACDGAVKSVRTYFDECNGEKDTRRSDYRKRTKRRGGRHGRNKDRVSSQYQEHPDSISLPNQPGSSNLVDMTSSNSYPRGLLSIDQVREVSNLIAQFNKDNSEIPVSQGVLEGFLMGVGAHHAGMLPAHRALTETLFRQGLMKVCFATETLAAGINMPARTTVVTSLSTRRDGGLESLLDTSNLLQMAGRAGRRGMDTSGTCVIMSKPFQGSDVAAALLTKPIEPISSHFRPTYTLAVNLILRGQGRLNLARRVLDRSFASWKARQYSAEPAPGSRRTVSLSDAGRSPEEKFVVELVQVLGNHSSADYPDLQSVVDRLRNWDQLRRQAHSVNASVEGLLTKRNIDAICEVANKIIDGSMRNGRKLRKALQRVYQTRRLVPEHLIRLVRGTSTLNSTQHEVIDVSWHHLLALAKVLTVYGGLRSTDTDEDIPFNFGKSAFEVTRAGTNVGTLNLENSLWCMVAIGGAWQVRENSRIHAAAACQQAKELARRIGDLSGAELAGYLSCLVGADSVRPFSMEGLTSHQRHAIASLRQVREDLLDVQREFLVDEHACRCPLDMSNCEVITLWAKGCSWHEALEVSGAAPGDLARILARTIDFVRQIGKLGIVASDGTMADSSPGGIDLDIRKQCREVARSMNRYPVKDPLALETEEANSDVLTVETSSTKTTTRQDW